MYVRVCLCVFLCFSENVWVGVTVDLWVGGANSSNCDLLLISSEKCNTICTHFLEGKKTLITSFINESLKHHFRSFKYIWVQKFFRSSLLLTVCNCRLWYFVFKAMDLQLKLTYDNILNMFRNQGRKFDHYRSGESDLSESQRSSLT